ncbi:uncharacterized protein N7487_004118 [Penicillium crustosum]|uniref:uncharacterized protein n=1 Tax=Penicillium crustosum TaxID=36656 RepID=UPI00238272C0|nr:uncharacterized protein N7487_004118 [Penicillium crustosum]KAJ5409759.1 hypothetical protein N7487_004118 [Penicillium crustosum]
MGQDKLRKMLVVGFVKGGLFFTICSAPISKAQQKLGRFVNERNTGFVESIELIFIRVAFPRWAKGDSVFCSRIKIQQLLHNIWDTT